MNTLLLSRPAIATRAGVEMNTLRLFSALIPKFSGNENFLLGIPFFAHQLPAAALRSSHAQCERSSSPVGKVPHHVRKVSFRTLRLPASVTLVNNVF
jgi:hypothetical protein